MELKTNNIHVIVDKNFNTYKSDEAIVGSYTDNEEARKVVDDLNLKHYLEIEGTIRNSDISTRYIVMGISDAINFIVNQIKPLNT